MDEKSNQSENRKTEKRLTIKSFAENGQVAVYVSDTGIGMSKEIKNKLWSPFLPPKRSAKEPDWV
jgi:C4-dicarboxylate-specific signal transduction histidine kinase